MKYLPLILAFLPISLSASPAGAVFPTRPTLTECLVLAVENNPMLRLAREQIREQQGVDIEIQAADMPSLSAQGGGVYMEKDRLEPFDSMLSPGSASSGSLPFSMRSPHQEMWNVGLRVSYNVYAGGAVQAGKEAQRNQIAAAQARFEATLANVLLQVRSDFYGAMLARSRIAVREDAVKLNEQQLKLARNRLDSGAGSQFDVLRAEVALSNARPPLIRAREDHRVALNHLRNTIGVPFAAGQESGDVDIQGEWDVPETDFDLQALLEKASANRPEVIGANAVVEAARHAVEVARGGRRPRVDVYGDYGIRRSTFGEEEPHGFEVGAVASWPIWDADLTRGRVEQAEARLRQAEASRDHLMLHIEQEVRDAYSDRLVSSEILQTSDEVIHQAEEAVRLAQSRFEAGAGTQIDVLSAQLELIQARLEKDSAAHNLLLAIARLYKAAGEDGMTL